MVLLAPGRSARECVRTPGLPPARLPYGKEKRKNRYAKPILSVPTTLFSTHRARLAPPPTCTRSTCLQPRRLSKPIPSVPASLSSTPHATTHPAFHVHRICPPPTSPAPCTSDPPITSSPLHPAQHQLQQRKNKLLKQ